MYQAWSKLCRSFASSALLLVMTLILSGCATGMLDNRFSKESPKESPKEQNSNSEVDAARMLADADQYYRKGQYQLAEQYYRSFVERNKRHPEALYRLGNIAFRAERHKDAANYYSKALESDPNNKKINYNLAITYLSLVEHYLKSYIDLAGNNENRAKITQLLQGIYQFAHGETAVAAPQQQINPPSSLSGRGGAVRQGVGATQAELPWGNRNTTQPFYGSDSHATQPTHDQRGDRSPPPQWGESHTTQPAGNKGEGDKGSEPDPLDSLADQF